LCVALLAEQAQRLGPLAAALAGLVARSPLPVELRASAERAAPMIEAAIYFTVTEALTNIAKHAHATWASDTVDAADGALVAEVVADGLEAVGGTSVESAPASGTRETAGADDPDPHSGYLGSGGPVRSRTAGVAPEPLKRGATWPQGSSRSTSGRNTVGVWS
jgi:hypothetical protein